ncbi:1-phosphofructokinase [Sporosalibacterium faouarense]|uniref:1-phosphofructokinase n=1 Tax=Sporosalibacterium faouarense TaxID=516123 RepID=UPI00192C1094|nr:1-phosphofructokinase [Sporosalibacterium faouarense]
MILTVTLNPAIDQTIYIEDFKKGEVNKVDYSVKDPGGKGINVSRVMKNFEIQSTAIGFIGGKSGEFIKDFLFKNSINEDFTKVKEDTRTNIKIVDSISGSTTDINQRGAYISSDEQIEFLNTYKKMVKESNIVVIAGSVPDGIENIVYKSLIEIANEAECKVILDASGDLLKEGIKGKPFMIKPNIHELEELLSIKLNDKEDIVKAARELVDTGIELVCISMGKEGSILVSREDVYQAKPVEVTVKSTVGAGDSLVAGFTIGLAQELSVKEAFRLGVATSIIAVSKEGTKAANEKETYEMVERVEII